MSLSTPYQTNASSLLPNQNVGIRISLPGVNALSASPTQLIFDSSWPSVPTAFTSLGSLTSTSNYAIPHNLGFPAFTKVFILDSNKNIINNGYVIADYYGVNSSNVYLRNITSSSGAYYYINCYNIDLSVDIDYPSLPTISATTPYDANFGIKVSKVGKSSVSTDGRDFILHSRFRSPLIQAVKTQATMNPANATATGGAIQYINQSGLATWNYGFIKIGPTTSTNLGWPQGTYAYAPYYAQAYPTTTTDGVTTYLPFTGGDLGATLVILRDPFFAPTVTQVSY